MKKPSVVLDTNLFVAGFWNPGSASAWIIRQCALGEFTLVYTAAVKRELDRIMRQAGMSTDYRDRISSLLEQSEIVEPQAAAVTTEDRDDQKFLECAAGSDADYIISSDHHLLSLQRLGVTVILTPSEFRRKMEARISSREEGQQ